MVENPPVAWYKRVKDPKEQLEDIAQLFLGVPGELVPFLPFSASGHGGFVERPSVLARDSRSSNELVARRRRERILLPS